MALRCLLFSATEDEVRPIWQVLSDLGVEGEFCANGREAVQKVATGTFQIVIADWAEQAQAAAILKTAREQKAANRPLALAIVNEDARLAEALRAGANSALVRPLRVDAVRDTLKTACELLRAKQSQAAAGKSAPKPQGRAMGASAGAGAGQTYVGVPVTSFMPTAGAKAEDKKLRAGEFLQSSPPAPSAQFETESDVQRSKDLASGEPMDALKELEPMASAVRASGTQAEAAENPGALTGWASLQARLNKVAPPPPPEAAKEQALSAYGDTPSFAAAAAAPAKAREQARPEWRGNSALEASLPAYMAEDSTEAPTPVEPAAEKGSGRVVWLAAVALILGALLAVPRTRQMLWRVTGSGAKAGQNWLNPKPAPLPQPVPLHDSFGQSGDEYKLPVAENIPDATTDPSQIRIVPVIDPTAKAGKNSGANGAADAAGSSAAGDGTTESGTAAAQNPADTAAASSPAQGQGAAAAPAVMNASGAPHAAPAMQPRGNPAVGNSAIPSSLQSQTASSIPDSAGAKPVEAAMSSIEPVVLPETAAWTLLAQPVEAEYPAKAAGQRGSVLLQVLIARDGTVQDAKFVQGSLVFARSAIDAVKQWKFKPYVMNGRAVQVQSSITLNFKPPV